MSNRYDPVDETLPPVKAPLEPVSKRGVWVTVAGIVLAAAVAVSAAFGFDVCQFASSVGVTLAACTK